MRAATSAPPATMSSPRASIINGLVILSNSQLLFNAEHTNPPGGLEKYYRDNVIGGPGAFVMVAEDFNAFGKAIVKKLIAEIAAAPARRQHTAAARWAPPFGSGQGERFPSP